LLKADR